MFQIRKKEVLKSVSRNQTPYFTEFSADTTGDARWCAYVLSSEDEQKLVLETENETVTVCCAKYITSPIVAHQSVLFSAYQNAHVWQLFCAQIQNGSVVLTPLGEPQGKRSFLSVDSTKRIAVYEKRDGVHTKICITQYCGDGWSREKELTDGSFNCYDPVAAVSGDTVYVSACCFVDGNYHIYMFELDQNLNLISEPMRISDQKGSCFSPSVFPRQKGGVWVAWHSLSRIVEFDTSYVQSEIHNAQSALFNNFPDIYAGVFENGTLYHTVHEGEISISSEGLRVGGVMPAKHPQIFEADDEVYIVLRHYPENTPRNAVPDVSITTLTPDGWSPLYQIAARGLHETKPQIEVKPNGITLICGEDHRQSGWCLKGEYFDTQNTIDAVHYEIDMNRTALDRCIKTLVPHFILPVSAASMVQPAYQTDSAASYQLIWGQTHTHSNLSVCQRLVDQTIDFNYRFYQDVQKSQFGAVSDHGYNMWPLEMKKMHQKADYYYFPGAFIALPCYEWTGSDGTDGWGGPFGHLNPVYCEEDGTLDIHVAVNPNDDGNHPEGLWHAYQGRKIVTIPHHTADKAHPYNWDHYDETFVPIVEIFQDCRGECEQKNVLGQTDYSKTPKPGCWVLDALKRGYKLGFIGGGDHAGIARAGVFVSELTREALYDALSSRRCCASTGAGADLWFTANGQPMGSVVRDAVCTLKFSVRTGQEIAYVELVKDGDTIDRFCDMGKSFSYQFVAKEDAQHFYYFRVCTKDGEVFWTSPIWVN